MIVAPFTGAWIEIMLCVRVALRCFVAPFTGAWIEIFKIKAVLSHSPGSLPSRERGLKFLNFLKATPYSFKSLPSRERGLKYHARRHELSGDVAPFTGAWIEIKNDIEPYL